MRTKTGVIDVKFSTRGIPQYSIEMWHDGLNKHRVIKGADKHVLARKAEIQAEEWDERWASVSEKNIDRQRRADKRAELEENKSEAAARTEEAMAELERLRSLLQHTLAVNDAIDWEGLKKTDPFSEPVPDRPQRVPRPTAPQPPREPVASEKRFQAKLGVLEYIFPSRRRHSVAEAQARFAEARLKWEEDCAACEVQAANLVRDYAQRVALSEQQHEQAKEEWERRKAHYLKLQGEHNEAVEAQRRDYLSGHAEAIVEYCDLVLSNSEYPDCFPQEFELEYVDANRTLLVNYTLPAPEDLPTLKCVKYVASRGEFEEQFLSEAQANKQYDEALYQVCLRTLHELFEADVINCLEAVVFNGVVTSTDRTTGQRVTACVLSLRANRTEFMAINLALVDPKACFKSLKGVGSAKLVGLSPVAPIMAMSREDARFVPSQAVADTLDSGSNLAAMNWEDFEHLIREVFEKEFAASGGEVRVTQASRDGGVDAVAFDPDPIRGGKLVIQAKRYTNTVGVSAVRDLYGTVMNEGANKGILVTTADYGTDSYDFAKGKPLVLLNGANLLHMLQRHGFRAHIDLKEARRLAATA